MHGSLIRHFLGVVEGSRLLSFWLISEGRYVVLPASQTIRNIRETFRICCCWLLCVFSNKLTPAKNLIHNKNKEKAEVSP